MANINQQTDLGRLQVIYDKAKEAILSGCMPKYELTFDVREVPFYDRSVTQFKQHEQSGKFTVTIICE